MPSGPPTASVGAVVVDYDAGPVLADCVASLRAEGVEDLVVVENGGAGGAGGALGSAGAAVAGTGDEAVAIVTPGRNLGYGAGANRGVAALGDEELVLVCNPDLTVHRGAVGALVGALADEPAWAIVGPRLCNPDGTVYPSVRRFPSMADAAGHALVALFRPDNRFSRRYRPPDAGGEGRRPADWVSGACFLVRRSAWEELGGFDEGYFMFAEDMDLCWRAHRAGWGVGVEPSARVTHAEGVSRRRHPYRMLVAHHRSAWRFARRTTTGWRRAALPLAAAVLAVRFALALVQRVLVRA